VKLLLRTHEMSKPGWMGSANTGDAGPYEWNENTDYERGFKDGVEAAARAVLEAKMEFKNAAGQGTVITDYAIEGQSFKKHAARAIRALVTVQDKQDG
jgi:hypothetical protein